MQLYTLQRQHLIPLSPVETFDFFADAFNLEAITPPWLGFEMATPRPIAMGAGSLGAGGAEEGRGRCSRARRASDMTSA
jgi:hypothetical protein